jgi:type IX secretion system PorP/SprF family membrane protein
MKKRFLVGSIAILLAGLFSSNVVTAQDAHFSQYFSAPLTLNPSLTGQFNGSVRVAALYRTQWQAIDYGSSFGLSVDTRKKGWGFGLTVLDLQGGAIDFRYLNALASVSYDLTYKRKGANHFIVGAQVGMLQKSVSTSKSTFGSQYLDGFGFDSSNDSGENLGNPNASGLDLNVGAFWFNGTAGRKYSPFIGASAAHLSNTDLAFGSEEDKVGTRIAVHGGVKIRVRQKLDITPHFQYLQHLNNPTDWIMGVNFAYGIVDTRTVLVGGVSYRWDDAAIPYVGLLYNDFQFGISYDVNLSALSDVGKNKNAVELSLIYIRRKQKIEEKFICPRL